MGDSIGVLKEHSIESIHEKTRIAHENIKKLLAKDFSAFSKVQFMGFVSIIEREYGVDLSSYREAYFEAMGGKPKSTPKPEAYVTPEEHTQRFKGLSLLLSIVIAVVVVVFFVSNRSPEAPVAVEPIQTVLDDAKLNLETITKEQEALKAEPVVEQNTSNESLDSAQEEVAEHPNRLLILPKKRVWMGLIEQPDGRRIQKVLQDAYELNTSKEWLIVFGHGYLDIESNDKLIEYTDRNKLWFVYEGGTLEQIDKATFKMRNQGKSW